MSADGRNGLTIIAFVGSVFSPWYGWSGRGRPENHCALNVAFYGPGCDRWTMTERGEGQVERDAANLRIGPSALSWDGDDLIIRIDEITAPVPPMPMLPRRLKGTVRVSPTAINDEAFAIDGAGRHVWRPIAPRARIAVTLDEPGLSWTGEGYLDTNAGVEPLEDAFAVWDWSRAHLKQDSAVLYDLKKRDGSALSLALRFDRHGRPEPVEPPPHAALPKTVWRMERHTRADEDRPVEVVHTWEDTPFYSRSAIRTHLFGEPCEAIHESLSLGRLRSPVVRGMLPFRMPRALR
jgi:carotenoid 1,2-hydratase